VAVNEEKRCEDEFTATYGEQGRTISGETAKRLIDSSFKRGKTYE